MSKTWTREDMEQKCLVKSEISMQAACGRNESLRVVSVARGLMFI